MNIPDKFDCTGSGVCPRHKKPRFINDENISCCQRIENAIFELDVFVLKGQKMRKLILFFSCGALGVLLSACASTGSTIYTYDSDGRVTQKTVTSESVIKTVTDSTKNKSVVMWEDGWAAYMSVSSGTLEDPTPHGKIFMGKVNKGAVSLLPNQNGLTGISRIIQATKNDVSASLTDGLESSSSEIQTNGSGK